MIPNRLVLDTNVCLDLFVFHDPRWHVLLSGLETGALEAVTRSDCRREWLIVLGYAHLPLNALSRPASMARFDALIRCLPEYPAEEEVRRLPVCRDKDDQKFLELARDADASVLITKDKALLKLAGKTRRNGMFEVMTPEAWTGKWSQPVQ